MDRIKLQVHALIEMVRHLKSLSLVQNYVPI